jgi:hypothetical protein
VFTVHSCVHTRSLTNNIGHMLLLHTCRHVYRHAFSCLCTHPHQHTSSNSHTALQYTHACVNILPTSTLTHSIPCICTHSHVQIHSQVHTHVSICTHTCKYTLVYIRSHMQHPTRTHTYVNTFTDICTHHPHVHTHMQIHSNVFIFTHTHFHTPIHNLFSPSLSLSLFCQPAHIYGLIRKRTIKY